MDKTIANKSESKGFVMQKNSPFYTIGFMVIICIVFGTGVATVNYATQTLLKKNEALFRNRALCKAFILPVESKTAEAYEKIISKYITKDSIIADKRQFDIFINKEDSSIGFIFSGIGFWDEITGIAVFSSDLSQFKNIQFLSQHETPGLGARIEEVWFTDQFKNLSINWENNSLPPIIIGTSPIPNLKNRIDAITGATQTSMALMKTLNSELALFKKAYLLRNKKNG